MVTDPTSLGGGQRVVVRARGVPADASRVRIVAGGVPCDVNFVRDGHVECTMRPRDTVLEAAAARGPVWAPYVGGRGLRWDAWVDIQGGLHNLRARADFPAQPHFSEVRDAASGPVDWRDHYGSRLSGYFTAPVAAEYVFYLASDDSSELRLGLDGSAAETVLVASVSGWTRRGEWDRFPSQQSAPIRLDAGQRCYLEALHHEQGGQDLLDVGVLIRTPTPFLASQSTSIVSDVVTLEAEDADMDELLRISVTGGHAPGCEIQLTLADRSSSPVPCAADADAMSAAVASLFGSRCTRITSPDNVFYDLDEFEGGPSSSDQWQARNHGAPTVQARDAYCGRYSLFMEDKGRGGSWGRNFEGTAGLEPGQTSSGFHVLDFPFMCMAYKVPPDTHASMLVHVVGVGWRTITMTSPTASAAYPRVASWHVVPDGGWHYTCIDLSMQLLETLDDNNYRINGVIWHESGSQAVGSFWIDDFSISSHPQQLEVVSTLPVNVLDVRAALAEPSSALTGRVWDVAVRVHQCGTPLPHVGVSSLGPAAQNVSAWVDSVREPLALLGSLHVEFPGHGAVPIPVHSDAAAVQELLTQLPRLGPVTVTSSGSCHGRRWSITFAAQHSVFAAGLPLDTSSLQGRAPTATCTVDRLGGVFLAPIPGDLLTAAANVTSVRLFVDEMEASCGRSSDCGIRFSDVVTPRLLNIHPAVVRGGDSLLVLLQAPAENGDASWEAADLSVRIGYDVCRITERTVTQLRCEPPPLPAGSYPVLVHVAGMGYALPLGATALNVSAVQVTYELWVETVSPAAGSTLGGWTVELRGRGFSAELAHNKVVLRWTGTVERLVPWSGEEGDDGAGGSFARRRMLSAADNYWGPDFENDTIPDLGNGGANDTGGPTEYDDVWLGGGNETADANGTELSDSRLANFTAANGTSCEHAVTGCTPSDGGSGQLPLILRNVTITVEATCQVVSAAATVLRCIMPLVPEEAVGLGQPAMLVQVQSSPVPTSSSGAEQVEQRVPHAIRYDSSETPSIHAVWPPAASVAGGTEITLLGQLLSPPEGGAENVSVTVGGRCEVLLVNDTTIVCRTTAAGQMGSVEPVVIIAGRGRATVAGTASLLLQRNPRIASIEPRHGSSGTIITVAGAGFSDHPSSNVVTLDGAPCQVLTATSTQLTCAAPYRDQLGHTYAAVAVRGVGVAVVDGELSRVRFTYSAEIWSVEPRVVSLAGGARMVIRGVGFLGSQHAAQASPSTPLLRLVHAFATSSSVADTAAVSEAACTLTHISDSEIECLLGPAPLWQAEQAAGSIGASSFLDVQHVHVLHATCTIADALGCTVRYAGQNTTRLVSVAPAQVISGDKLVLALEHYAGQQLEITVGNAPCEITAPAIRGSVECEVPHLPAGQHSVAVFVHDSAPGWALEGDPGGPIRVSIRPVLLSVSSIVPGSIAGGATVEVEARSLATEAGHVHATVGGRPCTIINANLTHLSCIAPPYPYFGDALQAPMSMLAALEEPGGDWESVPDELDADGAWGWGNGYALSYRSGAVPPAGESCHSTTGGALLMRPQPEWTDYTASIRVNMVPGGGAAGMLVRAGSSANYAVLSISRSPPCVTFSAVVNGSMQELFSHAPEKDIVGQEWTTLSVSVRDSHVVARVGSQEVLNSSFAVLGAELRAGGVGLRAWRQAEAAFAALQVQFDHDALPHGGHVAVRVSVDGQAAVCDAACAEASRFQYTDAATPKVDGLSLNVEGPPETAVEAMPGQWLHIFGHHLAAGSARVLLGGRSACTELNGSDTLLACRLAALPAGLYQLVAVIDPNGVAFGASLSVRIPLRPTLASSPITASYAGGTTLQIGGTGVDGTRATATVCGRRCTPLTLESDSADMLCALPPIAAPQWTPAVARIDVAAQSVAVASLESSAIEVDSGTLRMGMLGAEAAQTAVMFHLPVPNGAVLLDAVVSFVSNQPSTGALRLAVAAEQSGRPQGYAGLSAAELRERAVGATTAKWEPLDWVAGRRAYELHNLTAVVQEAVLRPDWGPHGGHLSLMLRHVSGAARRVAESPSSCCAGGLAPRLALQYRAPTASEAFMRAPEGELALGVDCPLDVLVRDRPIVPQPVSETLLETGHSSDVTCASLNSSVLRNVAVQQGEGDVAAPAVEASSTWSAQGDVLRESDLQALRILSHAELLQLWPLPPHAGPHGEHDAVVPVPSMALQLARGVELGASWTIDCWFKMPLPAWSGTWFTLVRGSQHHQVIVQRSSSELGVFDGTQQQFWGSGIRLTPALAHGWHRLTVVGEGGRQYFYVDNGALRGQANFQSTSDVRQFGSSGATQAFGPFAALQVLSRSLTRGEVARLPLLAHQYGASLLLDGDEATFWMSGPAPAGAEARASFVEQLELDIGHAVVASEVHVLWRRAPQRLAMDVLSADATGALPQWREVFNAPRPHGSASSDENMVVDELLFHRAIRFQRIRLRMTGVSGVDVPISGAFAIAEVSVPGCRPGVPHARVGNAVQYGRDHTPVVQRVRPQRGSTAGGTQLTLEGTGFLPGASVRVAGTECVVEFVNASLIRCQTGAHGRAAPPADVLVTLPGGSMSIAAADGEAAFQYVDLWSSPTSWGGMPPPGEGDSVVIPPDQTILMDVSPPPLYTIIVQGTLIFDDSHDLALDAHYILVNGGALRVGTEAAPFRKRAVITLRGTPLSPELPVYGAKVLMVRHGELDLHGRPVRVTWTRLAETARADATVLALVDPVDWDVGSRIAVAPTDHSMEHAEEVGITHVSADGRTVHLDRPLLHKHLGEVRWFGGHAVEMRAEVGLLTRNVVVQGDDASASFRFGATIMLHSPEHESVVARIEHVEVRNAGQAFRMGRYPIHLHMVGQVRQSYIRGCSVHHSFNRAFTIHGVHYLRVQRNVAYEIMGHAYFIEDAVETKNVIEGNLGLVIRASSTLLNTDQTPAAFWITNPDNVVRHNAAAGSQNYGFWISPEPHATGASAGLSHNICPQHTPLLQFRDNVAHSNGRYGLRIYEVFKPRQRPCDPSSPFVTAVFQHVLSYRNGLNGAQVSAVAHLVLADCAFVDNALAGVEMPGAQGGELAGPWGANQLRNVLFVGSSGPDYVPRQNYGMIGPAQHGLLLTNVTFANFFHPGSYALRACAKCEAFTPQGGGWEVQFERVSWLQSPNRVWWRWRHEGVYLDLDGSLTGRGPGTSVVAFNELLARLPSCAVQAGYDGGIGGAVCVATQFRRVAANGMVPQSLWYRDLLLSYQGATTRVPFGLKRRTHPNGYVFMMPTQQEHTLAWDLAPAVNLDALNFGVSDLRAEDALWLRLPFVQEPDHYSVSLQGWSAQFSPLNLTALGPMVRPPAAAAGGSYVLDRANRSMSLLVRTADAAGPGPRFTNGRVVTEYCPRAGCPIPPRQFADGIMLWSDPVTWNGTYGPGRIPGAGDNVAIPSPRTVILDVTTPILGRVEVFGSLVFDDESDLALSAQSIVIRQGGRLVVGNATAPFRHQANITLYGDRESPGVRLGRLAVPAKSLVVLGELEMHGRDVGRPWTRLAADVSAGDTTILLQDPVPWRSGDRVVLASTDFDPHHAEVRTIVSVGSVAGAGSSVTLSQPLLYRHVGHTEAAGSRALPMHGEVALLSRTINIQGGEASPWATHAEQEFGCAVHVGRMVAGTAGHPTEVGRARLAFVGFRHCGQLHSAAAFALSFDSLASLGAQSRARGCSFDVSYNTALGVRGSSGVQLQDNVARFTVGSSFVLASAGNTLTRNLALQTVHALTHRRAPAAGQPAVQLSMYAAAFWVQGANRVEGNAAAGSERIGFLLSPPPPCSTAAAEAAGASFRNNVAHATMLGVVAHGDFSPLRCVAIRDVVVYKSWVYGVYAYVAQNLELQRLHIGDCKVGVLANSFLPPSLSHRFEHKYIQISKSLLLGRSTANGDCAEPRPPKRDVWAWSQTRHHTGILTSSFGSQLNKAPFKDPWHSPGGYPALYGRVRVSDVTVGRFGAAAGCERRDVFMETNWESPDATHPHEFERIEMVQVEPDSIARFRSPNPSWINQDDCIDMDCPGLNHVLFNDLDGTLTGARGGSVVARAEYRSPNAVGARVPDLLLVDPATGAVRPESEVVSQWGIYREGCILQPTWNAWRCATPTADGRGLAHRMLIMESMDGDTEVRRLSPLALTSGGYTDLINEPMDHGWCSGYTCLRRISTYWAVVSSGRNYSVVFTGTMPQTMRFHLINADEQDSVVLRVVYTPPYRLEVRLGSQVVEDMNFEGGRHKSTFAHYGGAMYRDAWPTPAMPAGTNAYHRGSRTMHVVLRAGAPVEVRTLPVVQVSLTLAVNIDDFFEAHFVDNVAATLSIDPARIRVVSVVAGSVNVDFEIAPPPPPPCQDGLLSPAEADVDCGGVCDTPCPPAASCAAAADCASRVCTAALCTHPTCSDGVANGEETDVDCGGADCAGCAAGERCETAADCSSRQCSQGGVCLSASCGDGASLWLA